MKHRIRLFIRRFRWHRLRDMWFVFTKQEYIIILTAEEPAPENDDSGFVVYHDTIPNWVARAALNAGWHHVTADIQEDDAIEELLVNCQINPQS